MVPARLRPFPLEYHDVKSPCVPDTVGAGQMSWYMRPAVGKESWARAQELKDQELQGRKGFSHLQKKFSKELEQTKGKVS